MATENTTVAVSIRFTAKQRQILEAAARESGLRPGPWIRMVGLREAKRRERAKRREEAADPERAA